MHNTEQTLSTAIGELNCLSPGAPATLEELIALNIARECIDQMLRSCVDELRTHPQNPRTWSDIADAISSPSASAARKLYGSPHSADNEQVRLFWEAFAECFAWDFLPRDFLHALYVQWMGTNPSEEGHLQPLPKKTFTRRLMAAATASGEWFHTRSRPGSLMDATEPLATRLPNWSHDGSDAAIYGFRRNA